MMSDVGSGSGVQVIDSPLLTQQIEAQRLCIKHLKNENNRLKVKVPTSDWLNILNCRDPDPEPAAGSDSDTFSLPG